MSMVDDIAQRTTDGIRLVHQQFLRDMQLKCSKCWPSNLEDCNGEFETCRKCEDISLKWYVSSYLLPRILLSPSEDPWPIPIQARSCATGGSRNVCSSAKMLRLLARTLRKSPASRPTCGTRDSRIVIAFLHQDESIKQK